MSPAGSSVKRIKLPLSISSKYRFRFPSRAELKASQRPSGDQAGSKSVPGDWVRRVASPYSASIWVAVGLGNGVALAGTGVEGPAAAAEAATIVAACCSTVGPPRRPQPLVTAMKAASTNRS